ncbi:hypothetical protein GG851_25805 [Bordetella petrii]|nr:hypothetical protein [Bordetella petrii]
MHHALIVSAQPGWAAQSGVSGTLAGLGLSVREAPRLDGTGDFHYAVIILHSVEGQRALGSAPDQPVAVPGAIVLTSGVASAQPAAARGRLPLPVTEASLAAALAAAGYAVPLPAHEAILQHVGQLVDCDAEVTAELVASLLATNRVDLHKLRDACAAGRWPDVRASAHRIKGTAHLAGAAALAALSLRVETLAQQGQGETVRALMLLYEPAVERLSQALAILAG